MSFFVFSCRSCGAGVEAPPDNLLVVCSFCGDRYPSKQLGDIPISVIPSQSKEAVNRAVRKRMALDRQMKGKKIEIDSVEGVYVPIFITKASIEGTWKGYKKVKRNKKTIKRQKNGYFDHMGDYPVLGRKHAHEFGMSSIGYVIFDQESQSFAELDWSSVGLPVLAVDVDESMIDLIIKDDLVDHMGVEVKKTKNLDAITEFEVDVQLYDRCIVLFPFWTVIYRYQGGTYRVAVSGGDLQILSAMEPVFMGNRIWNWLKGVAGIVGAGFLCDLAVPILYSGSDDVGEILIAIIAGIGFCAYVSWSTASRMTASIQVETIGKEEELVS
ncbi:MAG: hypothetical protein VX278_22725 [Myxococcota bacterium]|nr:hypothetical protein [Myxococcota bacterium]